MPDPTADPTADSTADSPPTSSFGIRDGRLWTAWLWAVVLGLGVAAVTATSQEFSNRAAERVALVLPVEDFDEAGRKALQAEISAAEGVAKTTWISPQGLAQRTASSITRELWGELRLGDDSWLPWIATVRFEDPIADPNAVRGTITSLRKNERIRIVLWDQGALERDAQIAGQVRSGAVGIGLFVGALGALALWFMPAATTAGWWWNVALSPIPAAIVVSQLTAAKAFSAAVDSSIQALGAGVAFILAGVIAPMLIHRANFKRNGASVEK